MCRLYGFRASHPSRLDCDLVKARNALVRQSREDAEGDPNPDGWGLGLVRGGRISRRREATPAYDSDGYGSGARAACADTVLAHVRRATVGPPAPENTHPFRHGNSMLIHNGEIGVFPRIRDRMREAMAPWFRRSVEGSTDSEHFFHLLLTRWTELGGDPGDPDPGRMRRALRATVEDVIGWHRNVARDAGEEPPLTLNVLWATGGTLAGMRFGRSLWFVERDGPHRCGTCGGSHPDGPPADYRAVVLASERITDEDWSPVPERTIFSVTPGFSIDFDALEASAAA